MNGTSYTVAGVMPDGFVDPLDRPGRRLGAAGPVRPGRDLDNVDNHYLSVIARLRPDVTIARAQGELDRLSVAARGAVSRRARYAAARLDPLKEDIVGRSSRALEIMLGAVALVLVLICVNLANLLLVRGLGPRARVRAALGVRCRAPPARPADVDREPDAGDRR